MRHLCLGNTGDFTRQGKKSLAHLDGRLYPSEINTPSKYGLVHLGEALSPEALSKTFERGDVSLVGTLRGLRKLEIMPNEYFEESDSGLATVAFSVHSLINQSLSLRSITIEMDGGVDWVSLEAMLPISVLLHLRKVDMTDFEASMHGMVRFLASYAKTLKDVHFVYAKILDGKWHRVLSQLRPTSFERLKSFILLKCENDWDGGVKCHDYLLHNTDENPMDVKFY